jgi:hypothetical protein
LLIWTFSDHLVNCYFDYDHHCSNIRTSVSCYLWTSRSYFTKSHYGDCMQVCVYILHIYMCIHIWMCTSRYVSLYLYTSICIYERSFQYVHIYIFWDILMNMHIYLCICRWDCYDTIALTFSNYYNFSSLLNHQYLYLYYCSQFFPNTTCPGSPCRMGEKFNPKHVHP